MNYLNRLTIHKLSSWRLKDQKPPTRFSTNFKPQQKPLELKLTKICVYTSFLTLLIGLISLTLGAEEVPSNVSQDTAGARTSDRKVDENPVDSDAPKTADAGSAEEEINGTAEHLERYELQGITILTGNVEILRTDGYLNADKVTFYTDTETGETVRTVAEGNVEIRDADIFATCAHATMEHVENTIILEHNVVVLQNKDRLETALFKFNRTTGKQIGEGGVKFKVRVKQAEPVEATTDGAAAAADAGTGAANAGTGAADAGTGEEKTAPAETEAEVEADADVDEADTEKETAPVETEEAPEAETDDTAPGD